MFVKFMKSLILTAMELSNSKLVIKLVSFFYLEYTNQYLNYLSRKYKIKRFEGFEQNVEIAFLGSGASINKISNLRWKKIARMTTIGPNGWMFNEKSADFYTLEGRGGAIQEPHLSEFKAVLHSEPHKFRGRIVLIHVSAVKSVEDLRSASSLDVEFLLYGHVKPLTLSGQRLATAIREMLKICGRDRYRGIAIGKGSTLERVISFSIASDAKGLLLAGVDLHNRATFYDQNALLVNRLGIKIEDSQSGVHKTNDPSVKRFTVTEMLSAFRSASGRSPSFIKIESSESALSGLLPIWN